MKAYEIREFGIDKLAVADRPDPQPGPGQVLLRMRAWSLNYRDLLVVKGLRNRRVSEAMARASQLGVPLRFETRETLDRLAAGPQEFD